MILPIVKSESPFERYCFFVEIGPYQYRVGGAYDDEKVKRLVDMLVELSPQYQATKTVYFETETGQPSQGLMLPGKELNLDKMRTWDQRLAEDRKLFFAANAISVVALLGELA